jgi:hypothetical protein
MQRQGFCAAQIVTEFTARWGIALGKLGGTRMA